MRAFQLTNTTHRPFFVFAFIALLFALTLKGMSGNLHPLGTGSEKIQVNTPPFETSMERGRYAQVVSLASDGDFDVTEFRQFLKPDIAWYNGRFLSTFPPGVAFLATPLYVFGKVLNHAQVVTFATSALFSLLTAFVTYKTALKLKLSKQASLLAATVFALGTVAWPYSVSFSAHPVSAFSTILGAFFLVDVIYAQKPKATSLAVIGFLAGINFVIDYPNILIFAPIVITAFLYNIVNIDKDGDYLNIEQNFVHKWPLVVSFVLALVPFVLFNFAYYDKPIAFTNTYTIKFLETEGINFEDMQLSNKLFENREYSSRFSVAQSVRGIQTLLISSDRGLLFFSPLFIFALFGIYFGVKNYKLWTLTAVACFCLNVVLYGSYDDPWGGWAFGPRYLIVTLPLLCIFVAQAFESLTARFGLSIKIVFFTLLAFGSAVALLGALTTNAVPPSIEVVGTGEASNFMLNWNYITKVGTSSFVFNSVNQDFVAPITYFYLLLVLVVIFEFLLVFSKRTKKDN